MFRINLFSKTNEEKRDLKFLVGGAGALGGGIILGNTKTGRLTGKVTRYHNTNIENVEDILLNGLKSKFAEDPDNITNAVLGDVSMDKKKGLVYTAKNKATAKSVGIQRLNINNLKNGMKPFLALVDAMRNYKKKTKTLKLEFDYDDIKNNERISNPELRGAKNYKEFAKIRHMPNIVAKDAWKALNDDTHVFRGDISSKNIVGGKGYQKRTLELVKKYIKNNPARFSKEAAKVATGLALTGGGISLMLKNRKKIDEKDNK